MSYLADASGAEDRTNPARHRRARRLHLLPYALALPTILYEIGMIVYPIAQGVYGSFQQIELASSVEPTMIPISMLCGTSSSGPTTGCR